MVLNEAVEVPSWMSTSFGQDLGCSLSYVDRLPSNRNKKLKKVGGRGSGRVGSVCVLLCECCRVCGCVVGVVVGVVCVGVVCVVCGCVVPVGCVVSEGVGVVWVWVCVLCVWFVVVLCVFCRCGSLPTATRR